MLNVVFALQGSDVGAAEGLTAVVAQQIESAEVVSLAQRILARGLLGDGEEFGGYNLAAVLDGVSGGGLVGRRARTWQVKHSR